jgi:hypothetical protein
MARELPEKISVDTTQAVGCPLWAEGRIFVDVILPVRGLVSSVSVRSSLLA